MSDNELFHVQAGIDGINGEIARLLAELAPVTERISGGARDRATLEKNNRLQEQISRLHDLRESLKTAAAEPNTDRP